jgi:aminoglycoside phosphotransferase (APT) family kinase protein
MMENAAISSWLEQTLGGTVVSLMREPRWRPSWRAVVERDGESKRLFIRGDRGQGYSYPLEREARVLRLLEQHRIPVPHVYGMIPDPLAIVMEDVSGKGQLDGITDPSAQREILDDYLRHLVRIHQIPLEAVASAGIEVPSTPQGLQLGFHAARSERFRILKSRPEPLVEFVMRWLARNVPTNRSRAGLAVKDAGQFLVEDGRVTAIYDLEIAGVMDPQADLAGMRVRDAFEPLGDLSYVLARYAELASDPIDVSTVNFHQMVGGLSGRQAITRLRTEAREDYVNYLGWEIAGGCSVLSALAEELEEELDRTPPAFEEVDDLLVPSLRVALARWGVPAESYDEGLTTDLVAHISLIRRRGASLDSSYIDDVAGLVGRRAESVVAADADLEAFVLSAGPGQDRKLLHLLHRQVQRQRAVFPDVDPATAGAGAPGPHLDRFYLEPVRSLLARAPRLVPGQ